MQPPFFIHAFLSTILIFLLSANVDAQYPGRKHYAGYYDYSRDLVYRTGKAEWSECHRPCNMPRGVKFRKNLCLLCSRDGRKCVKVADHKCGEENLGINLLSCYDVSIIGEWANARFLESERKILPGPLKLYIYWKDFFYYYASHTST